jgi:predicted ATPase
MPGLTSPLLEQGPEIGALDVALSRALSGTGVVLMVEGPAGIGKTAILEEARRRAATQGSGSGLPTGE